MNQKNLDIYGDKPIPWSRALEQLEAGTAKSFWLATVRPDGRPHVAAVGALWVDGQLYFTSGPATRKSRNLFENPACVFSVTLPDLDLVIEGTAAKVTDDATLQHLAQRYAAQAEGSRRASATAPSPPTTAPPAPGRRPGSSTSSRPARPSVLPPRRRTGPRAGASRADTLAPGRRQERQSTDPA